MINHSYKGLTQPLQTDTTKPRPAKRRVPGVITVATVTAAAAVCYPAAAAGAVCYPAAARTKTSNCNCNISTGSPLSKLIFSGALHIHQDSR